MQKPRLHRLAVGTLLALIAPLALAADIAGTWTITFEGAQGTRTNELTVVQTETGYSGSLTGQRGTTELESIAVEGADFSFSFTMQAPAGELDITYSGTVSGDTLTGTIAAPMGSVPFTGARKE